MSKNGEIQSRGEFRKGKRQGLWTYTCDNGQKYWEGSYRNDLEEGEFHSWHENGILDHVVTFEKGLREGKVTYADETGQKSARGHLVSRKEARPRGRLRRPGKSRQPAPLSARKTHRIATIVPASADQSSSQRPSMGLRELGHAKQPGKVQADKTPVHIRRGITPVETARIVACTPSRPTSLLLTFARRRLPAPASGESRAPAHAGASDYRARAEV